MSCNKIASRNQFSNSKSYFYCFLYLSAFLHVSPSNGIPNLLQKHNYSVPACWTVLSRHQFNYFVLHPQFYLCLHWMLLTSSVENVQVFPRREGQVLWYTCHIPRIYYLRVCGRDEKVFVHLRFISFTCFYHFLVMTFWMFYCVVLKGTQWEAWGIE